MLQQVFTNDLHFRNKDGLFGINLFMVDDIIFDSLDIERPGSSINPYQNLEL